MPESYVVQIYRRDPASPRQMTGTVERVGNGKRVGFSSVEALWEFLAATPRPEHSAAQASRRAKVKRRALLPGANATSDQSKEEE